MTKINTPAIPRNRIKNYTKKQPASVAKVLDRLVEKGAAINGELVINLADVELIVIGIKLVIISASRLNKKSSPQSATDDEEYIRKMEQELKKIEKSISKIVTAETPQKAEKGIAKLVLTLVELIKQLLEGEAIRRIDKKQLTQTQIRKIGLTFKVLDKKIEELKKVFGIAEDLNLDLGPLGKVL